MPQASRRCGVLASHCGAPPAAAAAAAAAAGGSSDDAAQLHSVRPPHAELLPRQLSVTWEDPRSGPLRRRARIGWWNRVRQVLLVKKRFDLAARSTARDVAAWLRGRGVSVVVEPEALGDFAGLPTAAAQAALAAQGITPLAGIDGISAIDLVVVLGGDGTLLQVARLFSRSDRPLPPCLVLGMGSLGFLAHFGSKEWERVLDRVLHPGPRGPQQHGLHATMCTRLRVEVVAADGRRLGDVYHALNECVVAGQRQGALGKLVLSVDGDVVTIAEGDGVIVATPTGSTGYNLSCAGPMVSPSVPATVITPIAPHSLSFRPVIANELSTIELSLPAAARRGTMEVLCDGRAVEQLPAGGKVRIQTAKHPLPVVNSAGLDRDWFQGITSKLKWNTRGTVQADRDDTWGQPWSPGE